MGPVVWLIIAVVFALVELLTLDFSLIMLGLSALMVAGVSFAGVPLWAELIIFSLSSVITLLTFRPYLKKKFHAESSDHRFSTKALEGHTAKVIEPISSEAGAIGMVSIGGNFWSAQAAHAGESYAKGDTVQVLQIKGNTAFVWTGI